MKSAQAEPNNVTLTQRNPEDLEALKSLESSWRVKFALMFFGVALALILLEVGVRITNATIPERTKWSDRPHEYYVPERSPDNRDFLHPVAKAEGVFRIIVIGDSFTYGVDEQFDDAFPKRLERLLNLNEHQRKVEVLNWGVPGYSTAHELILVQRAVSNYQPDLVLLEITLNDPEIQPWRVTHPYQNQNGQISLQHPIFQYWKSLRLVVERVLNTMTHTDYKSYYFNLFRDPVTWGDFKSSVRQIAVTAGDHKVPVMAVVFPLFGHPFNYTYPFFKIHKKIDTLLSKTGIPYIDLLHAYAHIPPERLQTIPGKDTHPNEIAHRIAAENIYKGLEKFKLVPEDVKPKKILPHQRRIMLDEQLRHHLTLERTHDGLPSS